MERYNSISICSLETYSMLSRINNNNKNNLLQNISTTCLIVIIIIIILFIVLPRTGESFFFFFFFFRLFALCRVLCVRRVHFNVAHTLHAPC